MNLSPLGLALIQFFEAYRSKAYQDQGGVWTAGYGHTRGVTESTVCTPELATEWLREDLHNAEVIVNVYGLPITQHQYDALVSIVYNVGHIDHVSMQRLLASGQISQAADKFLAYDHVNGVPNEGLLRRRQLERSLFLDGVTT